MTEATEAGGNGDASADADDRLAAGPAPLWRRIARRLNLREIVRHNGLVLLALWGIAVAQPVLDLFGKNPEFFVANSLSKYEVAAFGVVMALGVPLVLIGVEIVAYAIHRTLGLAVHVFLVFGLGAFFGMYLARQLGVSNDLLSILAAVAAGGLILYGERRVAGVRMGLHYLAFAPVVFLAAFLLFSSTSKLLSESEATAAAGVSIGNPAPIVIVQMDEFPVASLLTEDGTINAERFPNFARLADEGTWYRNATSISPKTTDSVPAMMTGLIPELGALPTSADHPRSIFTLLGDQYEQHVTEPVTSVCPSTICVNRADEEKFNYRRSRQAVLDASVVYFQATLPPFLRESLPAVDRAWGGFIDDANVEQQDTSAALDPSGGAPASSGAEQSGSPPNNDPSYKWKNLGPQGWAPRYQAGLMDSMIDSIQPTERPGLFFAHATFPHIPWLLSPEGYQYVVSDARFVPGLENGGIWTEDNDYLVRQGFARHLLQVGYMDNLVGQMIDQLESQGLWEDALVVVLSDHGVAFTPGQNFRSPRADTVHEIYNIPLFIKYPGQTEGEISDVNALNLDVLPTIVDALDIETDWEFDGQSLLGDGPDRDSKPTYWDVGPDEVPLDFDGVMEVVQRDHDYLPNGDDWLGVFGQGVYADLVGEDLEDLDVRGDSGLTWTNDQQERLADWQPDADGLAPMLLAGSLESDGGDPPEDGIVVVNGRVAGVAGDFHEGEDGRVAFNALISEEILQRGANDVVLLLPTRSGAEQFETASLE